MSNNSHISALVNYYSREKGLPEAKIAEALEHMFLSAFKRMVPESAQIRNFAVEVDRRNDRASIFVLLTVVEDLATDEEGNPIGHIDPFNEVALSEARKSKSDCEIGDVLRSNITPKDFGRVAFQAGKQTLQQRLREAEKEMLFEEFKDRAGEIVRGTIKRFERGDVLVNLGKYEGVMPSRERLPNEDYNIDDNYMFYIVSVDNGVRGPEVKLSRKHPNLVRRLFEQEVHEIGSGLIQIKAIARDPGYRSKIAVQSEDKNLDPVGACVGIRGAKIREVNRELTQQERIDVVRWHADPVEFLKEAIRPVIPESVSIENEGKSLVVILSDDEQLARTVGRRGSNARLTARLLGMDVQFKTKPSAHEEVQDKIESAANELAAQLAISHDTALQIINLGGSNCEIIVEMGAELLHSELEIELTEAERIVALAKSLTA